MRNRHFLALDILGVAGIPFFALVLRFEGFDWPAGYLHTATVFAAASLPLRIGIARTAGLYSCIWRHASIAELERIIGAGAVIAVANGFLGAVILPLVGEVDVRMPYSTLVMDGMIGLAVFAAPRLAVRFLHRRRRRSSEGARTIIVGAGAAGQMIASEALSNHRADFQIVAFVDDDEAKVGQMLGGVRVEGRIEDLPALISAYAATDVVIAIPSARGTLVRQIVELAAAVGARTRTIPGLADLVSGRAQVASIRPVEIQDLLRRPPITTDLAKVGTLATGRTVLVTGAGGSIGSELCRQIGELEPELLVLLDHAENPIFEVEQELRRRFPFLKIAPMIGDIRDDSRLRRLFERFRPFAVFHAAAHKHVPLMEDNVIEAITNNVLGTRNVVNAAVEFGVTHFVLISTDKAVRPTSVMGATKRLAELIVRAAAARESRHFVAVRFGNVLGSSGSVVPTFMAQIERGGPITVTHPEMKRFFMTIPEAVQLVLQAGALGQGGELFVLDMGEPVRIADLARDLLRLSGLEEGHDIEIRYTGVRPGEKLFEEVLSQEEDTRATEHSKVIRVLADVPEERISGQIDELIRFATLAPHDEARVRGALVALVPDFIDPGIKPADVIDLQDEKRKRTSAEHRSA